MTAGNDFWTDPEMFTSGDFIKFENVGDTVTGTITAVRKHMFEDGKVVPQIEMDTADGAKTVTAGQVRLKAALAEKRPGVGDQLTITLSDVEKRAGGKTLKHFTVTVGPVAAAPAPVAAPVAAPVVTATGVTLTPEQEAAVRNLGLL